MFPAHLQLLLSNLSYRSRNIANLTQRSSSPIHRTIPLAAKDQSSTTVLTGSCPVHGVGHSFRPHALAEEDVEGTVLTLHLAGFTHAQPSAPTGSPPAASPFVGLMTRKPGLSMGFWQRQEGQLPPRRR